MSIEDGCCCKAHAKPHTQRVLANNNYLKVAEPQLFASLDRSMWLDDARTQTNVAEIKKLNHTELPDDFDLNNIGKGSSIILRWFCPEFGHGTYEASPKIALSRTYPCPKCTNNYNTSVSLSEMRIKYYITRLLETNSDQVSNTEVLTTYRIDKNGKDKRNIDIYIPALQIGIEYDGSSWHADITRDQDKDELCKANGIKLIRLREPGLPNYDTDAELINLTFSSSREKRTGVDNLLNDFDRITSAINNLTGKHLIAPKITLAELNTGIADSDERLQKYYDISKVDPATNNIISTTTMTLPEFYNNAGLNKTHIYDFYIDGELVDTTKTTTTAQLVNKAKNLKLPTDTIILKLVSKASQRETIYQIKKHFQK